MPDTTDDELDPPGRMVAGDPMATGVSTAADRARPQRRSIRVPFA